MSKYPRPGAWKRMPEPERDGIKDVGNPCILCEQNTLGLLWVEYTIFRGDDDVVRLCHGCRKQRQSAAIKSLANMVDKSEG